VAGADVFFLANTTNQAVQMALLFHVEGRSAEWWNPITGASTPVALTPGEHGASASVQLEAYESAVLVFGDQFAKPQPQAADVAPARTLDLSAGWKVTFERLGQSVEMTALKSWTEDEATRYYSGQAVYEKTIAVPESLLQGAHTVALDFGAGTPVEPATGRRPGTRALLESPVREAAVVWVNGQRAGTVWCPPYKLDVAKLLKAGDNAIRIVVGNTAINALAGQSLPDYKLLNLRYGDRFQPQTMDHLQPLPAGILGPVRLIAQ
jgi:hypothetical protein